MINITCEMCKKPSPEIGDFVSICNKCLWESCIGTPFEPEIDGTNRHCGCTATISEGDHRSELWMYVFGKREFPIKSPIDMVGFTEDPSIRMYQGELNALSEDQIERLVERMTKKFGITREEMLLEKGVIPIQGDNIVISWCQYHFRNLMVD